MYQLDHTFTRCIIPSVIPSTFIVNCLCLRKWSILIRVRENALRYVVPPRRRTTSFRIWQLRPWTELLQQAVHTFIWPNQQRDRTIGSVNSCRRQTPKNTRQLCQTDNARPWRTHLELGCLSSLPQTEVAKKEEYKERKKKEKRKQPNATPHVRIATFVSYCANKHPIP